MEYIFSILIFASIYAILAISLNLIVGYSGMLSVAHAAFYGVGAYATAILTTSYGVNFFISLAVGIVIAAVLAVLVGVVLSRFRDDYLALASIGFNVIIFSALLNLQSITHGPLGIPGIPRPAIFGFSISNSFLFFAFVLAVLAGVYAVSHFIVHSSFGRALRAIREDETALAVFGYQTTHFKLAIFVIGSALAAVAGSIFAAYISFIDPSSFGLSESILILAMIILGGLASLRGSVIGAFILIFLPEILRFVGLPDAVAAQVRQIIYGILLIVLMLYRPQGVRGEFRL